MSEQTKIEWADKTWNCWEGCEPCSAGCKNCYAKERAKRFKTDFVGSRIVRTEAYWKEPLKWNKAADELRIDPVFFNEPRPRVFPSLCDPFEDWSGGMVDHKGRQLFTISGAEWFTEAVYPECRPLTMADVRARLFRLIDATPHLDWLLLTKRPENVLRWKGEESFWPARSSHLVCNELESGITTTADFVERKNVWLGTSCENQETADKRIPELLKCRDLSPVLWLSCEPLLGPIDLRSINCRFNEGGSTDVNVLREGIDWVVAGGESGPNARPCSIDWLRSLRDQCSAAGVPYFLKQLGSVPTIRESTATDYRNATHAEMEWADGTLFQGNRVLLSDRKGGDPAEWPVDLRDCRAFPEAVKC